MAKTPQSKPDLSEHEEEGTPLEDVLRKLLAAKPDIKRAPDNQTSDEAAKAQEP